MQISRQLLVECLPGFFRRYFKRDSPCLIFRLPLDIHVEHVFSYLHVEDIICLRRVNKAFYFLTHEPVIWKRFLERMNLPVPPMRPTFLYSHHATDYEIEQMVTRAISLDDNWNATTPSIYTRNILPAHHKVQDMFILPGGKYLVASVRDDHGYRYHIVLYALDHPKGHRAIARFPIEVKAYHLYAKYMKFKGKTGIMITYATRAFSDGAQPGLDPSNYSHKVDVEEPYPMAYQQATLFISLNTLDSLVDPMVEPGSDAFISRASQVGSSFTVMFQSQTVYPVDHMSLFELEGECCVLMTQQPNLISISNFEREKTVSLYLKPMQQYEGWINRISAVRALPWQRGLLVICHHLHPDLVHEQEYSFRLYAIPRPGFDVEHIIEPFDINVIHDKYFSHFKISDYHFNFPTSAQDHPILYESRCPPPPISVFGYMDSPMGLVHYSIYPDFHDYPATKEKSAYRRYFYTLQHMYHQATHISSPHITHVLPGVYRSLTYTATQDNYDSPTMVRLRRYRSPHCESYPPDYPGVRPPTSDDITRKTKVLTRTRGFKDFDVSDEINEINHLGGVSAVAWDEGIGRLCIASQDGEDIMILDFAHIVQPDRRFDQWKRDQAMLGQESDAMDIS